jgi:hypothetical protein
VILLKRQDNLWFIVMLILAAALGVALFQSAPHTRPVVARLSPDLSVIGLDGLKKVHSGPLGEDNQGLPKPQRTPDAWVGAFVALPSPVSSVVEGIAVPVWGGTMIPEEKNNCQGFFTPLLVKRRLITFYQLSRSHLSDGDDEVPLSVY